MSRSLIQRVHNPRNGEEAAAEAAAADEQDPSPDAEIAEVQRSGRHHDLSDTAAYKRPLAGRRVCGPRR